MTLTRSAIQPSHHFIFGTLPLPPLDPKCRLSVTIPAKDEEEFIEDTLEALRTQTDGEGQPLDPAVYEVILLANNCNDATADVARSYGKKHPTMRLHVCERTLPRDVACVGTARRLMMDSALVRYLAVNRRDGVLSTTDADTKVHHEWVFRTLESIDNGARAVGGRILVARDKRSAATAYRKYHLQDVVYRYLQVCLESMIDPDPADPWPRHFQNFGPSTAARVSAYLKCGGMPPSRCLEDVGFAHALARHDIPVTHNPLVRVYTSSRVSNRVDGTAFSHQLDEWSDMSARSQKRMVISSANCRKFYKWKVALRRAFLHGFPPRNCAQLKQLAEAMGCSLIEFEQRVKAAPTFGSLFVDVYAQLEKCPKFNDTPIDEAIKGLRRLTRTVRSRNRVATA